MFRKLGEDLKMESGNYSAVGVDVTCEELGDQCFLAVILLLDKKAIPMRQFLNVVCSSVVSFLLTRFCPGTCPSSHHLWTMQNGAEAQNEISNRTGMQKKSALSPPLSLVSHESMGDHVGFDTFDTLRLHSFPSMSASWISDMISALVGSLRWSSDIGPPRAFRERTTGERLDLRWPISRLIKPQPSVNLKDKVPFGEDGHATRAGMHGMFDSM